MAQVEIADAAADLRNLIHRAASGEDVRLVEDGKERARLVVSRPVSNPLPRWGLLRGKVEVPPGMDLPLPADLIDLLEGH